MKKILLILIPIALAVVVGVTALIVLKNFSGERPLNPVKNLRQIVDNHDVKNFYRLVDVDAVLNSAAEEILTAQINSTIDALAYSTQNYVDTYENLKPEFVTAFKAALDEYIATGTIIFQEPLTPAQKFLKDSRIETCTIKNFAKSKTEDKATHMKVEFLNEGLSFYFELDLTLEKIDKSNWKVTDAKGFENYFAGYQRALRKKLEELNVPIRDQIKEIVDLKGFDAAIVEGDEYGFSQTLNLTIRAEIQSDKPISRITGNIIIDGKEDSEGVTPFSIDIIEHKQGVQDFSVNKVLNPFVREDADVMRHGLKRSSVHINVTQIDFVDGTTLKEVDEL